MLPANKLFRLVLVFVPVHACEQSSFRECLNYLGSKQQTRNESWSLME